MPQKLRSLICMIFSKPAMKMPMPVSAAALRRHSPILHLSAYFATASSHPRPQLPVVGHGKWVHHLRGHRREHCDKGGERELSPGILRQTVGREILKRIGKDVDIPRGEDHPRCKRLHDYEDVAVRLEGGDWAGEQREANAEHAGHKYRRNSDDLQLQRLGPVPTPAEGRRGVVRPTPDLVLVLLVRGDHFRSEHEEQEDEGGCLQGRNAPTLASPVAAGDKGSHL